jgi:predicted  nucleic acid-binding Zn-ribbon protein
MDKQGVNMKKIIFVILGLVILTLIAVSVFTYSTYRKYQASLNQIAGLQGEKLKLMAELDSEKSSLKEALGQVEASNGRVKEAQKNIEELKAQNAALKAENTAIRDENAGLKDEKEAINARFSSIPELKRAIQELKQRSRTVKRRVEQIIKKRFVVQKVPVDNRGFMLKDGKSTYVTAVRIEVEPASE